MTNSVVDEITCLVRSMILHRPDEESGRFDASSLPMFLNVSLLVFLDRIGEDSLDRGILAAIFALRRSPLEKV